MNKLSENRPFIFKTIGENGELRMRGLDQMADILEIAYTLFQDPFLNETLGDPFIVRLEDHPKESQTFNRTVIERTIQDCHTYGNIKFDGKHIAVSSQGIENTLGELEMIWFVANDLKEGEPNAQENEKVPHSVKLISMGKLAGILKYYLSTSHQLIADVRVKQLKEKLEATAEQDKKQVLLRIKTDLLIQKHQTKVIVDELLRVIELELDLLAQLDTHPKKMTENIPQPDKARTDQPSLPVAVDIDFEYEFSFDRNHWKDLFVKNEEFLEELKQEFAQLPPKPKKHWYFNESISEKEWEEDRYGRMPLTTTSSNRIIAASFVAPTPLEPKAWELSDKFNAMEREGSVDPKYYGRFLADTETLQNLEKLDHQLRNFKDYVFSEVSIDTYAEYGKNVANALLRIISKFKNPSFKLALLAEITKISLSTDIAIVVRFSGKPEHEITIFLKRFDILNLYVQELIHSAIEELSQIKKEKLKEKPAKPDFKSIFKDQEKALQYIDVLKKVSPPILGDKNHYLLGERKKGAVVCWFDILSSKGIVYSNIPPSQKAKLLNDMFPGLSISGRSTGSTIESAERKYRMELERLIDRI